MDTFVMHYAPSVSIHAPVRRRHNLVSVEIRYPVVSIHAPVRRRPLPVLGTVTYHTVSIHAPVRRRHASLGNNRSEYLFQSTPP